MSQLRDVFRSTRNLLCRPLHYPFTLPTGKVQRRNLKPHNDYIVQEELGQGWAYRFDGTLVEAKEKFPHLAVGRLGVAFSDNRTPRLVVDSSICGLNNRCVLPERTTLPSAKDVIGYFPLRDCRSDLAGFSLDLDIKSAHKRVVIRESEQGPLGFQLNGILYFYRVCPFGATFSAFLWQGLGAWILRFFHQTLWISHSVDDYLWLQKRQVLPLVAPFLAMICQTLGIPISWRKTELDSSIHWIGWTFHFVAGTSKFHSRNETHYSGTLINSLIIRVLPDHIWKRR